MMSSIIYFSFPADEVRTTVLGVTGRDAARQSILPTDALLIWGTRSGPHSRSSGSYRLLRGDR